MNSLNFPQFLSLFFKTRKYFYFICDQPDGAEVISARSLLIIFLPRVSFSVGKPEEHRRWDPGTSKLKQRTDLIWSGVPGTNLRDDGASKNTDLTSSNTSATIPIVHQ